MNSVLSYFEKQQSFYNDPTYDLSLRRLAATKTDSWKGIVPSEYTSDYNPEPPIFAAKFSDCPYYRHILAIANEDGKIALQDTSIESKDWDERALQGKQCHFNAVFDLEWAPGQMKFVSASGDHTAKLWDIGNDIKQIRTFNGHTRSVKTAVFRKNDPSVFASGGRDGAILIWDVRAHMLNAALSSKADNCIISGHAGGPGTPLSQRKRTGTPKLTSNAISSSITGLAFQDSNTLISCGAGDGVIKVWDLRRNYSCYKKEPMPKYCLPYAGSSTFKGFTNLIIDDAGVTLYVNCMDNIIYSYNLSNYSPNPLQRYVGLRNNTFYIKSCLSSDGNYLLSGSSDEKAYIWNLKNPEPLVSLNGHAVEVTCVAWGSSNGKPIVTCSDDARHKIWRVAPELIEESQKDFYSGHAQYLEKYKNNNVIQKNLLKDHENTPRSLKRIMQQNEKTPNSVEKISTKRSFTNMTDNNDNHGSDHKRTKLIETRGRRLFSPSTSSSSHLQVNIENVLGNLESISEDKEEHNQENTSPPTEAVDSHLSNSPIPSTSSRSLAVSSQSLIFSPTSNLPNYVVNGDAPHLGIMSPKRAAKDKVDWLTKIRKQKLMSGRRSLSDKLNIGSCLAISCDIDEARPLNAESCLSSPRLQNIKNDECSPKSRYSPRRRISNNESPPCPNVIPKTPTSSRRNSETSILKFFTISTSNQTENDDRYQQQPSTSFQTVPETHNHSQNLHNRPTTSRTTCSD